MFFSIGFSDFDNRFFEHYKLFDYFLSIDQGWKKKKIKQYQVFYKGYCDTKDVVELLPEFITDPTPKYTGNFGILIFQKNRVTITHDINRSFPLHLDTNNFITNISRLNTIKTYTADDLITIENKDIKIKKYNNFSNLDLNFDKKIKIDECADQIKTIINNKIDFLNRSKFPLNIFVTGGIDTTLLYAMAKTKIEKKYNLLNCEHIEYDRFLLKNYSTLKREFAVYNQMHAWKKPNILLSGAPGDEYFMRGPYVASIWAAWHDINLIEIFEKADRCYHRKHYFRESVKNSIEEIYRNRQQIKEQYPTYTDLSKQILNICANDHQIWHIGHTLTWTPFKDLNILTSVLKLPADQILKQIINGDFSRYLISLYNQDVLKIISTYKNFNGFENINEDDQLKEIFS